MDSAVVWYALFMSGYALSALGAAFILAHPIRHALGFDAAPVHADPDSEADALVVLIATIAGAALMWPLTIGIYAGRRFIPASAEIS